MMNKKWLADAAERVFWTAAAAVIAAAAVEISGVPEAYQAPLTIILTMAKVYVASHIGNKETAAITAPNK